MSQIHKKKKNEYKERVDELCELEHGDASHTNKQVMYHAKKGSHATYSHTKHIYIYKYDQICTNTYDNKKQYTIRHMKYSYTK